jgi:enoyl-CoA hydratase/carnithine racemase
MAYDYKTLAVTLDDGVLDVVLDRPEKRNAITHEMQDEIDALLDEAEVDDAVRAVVLRGNGAVFSAGHDLHDNERQSFADLRYPFHSPSRPPQMIRAWYFRKPLIAAVHGYVGPYALALVSCSDWVIAAEGTRFGTEIFRGNALHTDWMPLYLQLPMRVVEKLFLMGGWLDAEQALQLHFVQRVVPVDEVPAEARRWADQVALVDTVQFAHAKDQIRRSYELLGLSLVPAALNHFGPPRVETPDSFTALVREKGIAAAVRERDAQIDPSITKI